VYWKKAGCLYGPPLEKVGDPTRPLQTEGLNLSVAEVLAQYDGLVSGPGVEDLGVCLLLW
jgi:hypothetical protein